MATEPSLVSLILAGNDPQQIVTHLEHQLHARTHVLIESTKQSYAMSLLNEANPKPQVEKDHENQPVTPTTEDYLRYFEAMQANYIQDQLHKAHGRWQEAADRAEQAAKEAGENQTPAAKQKAAYASAQLAALKAEIGAAETVLQNKEHESAVS